MADEEQLAVLIVVIDFVAVRVSEEAADGDPVSVRTIVRLSEREDRDDEKDKTIVSVIVLRSLNERDPDLTSVAELETDEVRVALPLAESKAVSVVDLL